MGDSFWVHARGQWRPLELKSGRVGGWAGRARFCFVRRGRLQLAPAAAVLRGLRALHDGQPATVREGIPLSKRRRRAAPRALSPRCCCRGAASDARNALLQLSLTALQPAAAPLKTDAAVQATAVSQGSQSGRKRARSPGPLPPAKLSKPRPRRQPQSETSDSVLPCKELIVNEEDVATLRRFLQRTPDALFPVNLRRFDEDDAYKSALFYRINPLVCVTRDPRIPAMLRQQNLERRSLCAFARSLGLRAVSSLRPRAPYRMRPRSSDKENRSTPAVASPDRSPDRSPNKSRSSTKLVGRRDYSPSSHSDDFQPSRASDKKINMRTTRSTLDSIRKKYERERKKERDNDVRSQYLVKSRRKHSKRAKESNGDRSKVKTDKEILSPVKDKRNHIIQVEVHETRDRNDAKVNQDTSRSDANNRNERHTNVSPSILTRKRMKDNSEDGNSDLRDRRARLRDRPVIQLDSSTDQSKDKKRNAKDRGISVDIAKDSQTNVASSNKKTAFSNIVSPSKSSGSKRKREINNVPDSDASGNVWVNRNGTKDVRDESSRGKASVSQGTSGPRARLRRSAEQAGPALLRREYSSLEDHAIVQWLSLGNRARRVNGNAVWRELQEQFSRIAGRARSWHSLRNRYLRGILPVLGSLALPPLRVAALRAAQAKGEIKSRRRAPVPNPLLTLPTVRSAWGARPGARGPRDEEDDTQDTIIPATSESEPTRTLRSSMTHVPSPSKSPSNTASSKPPSNAASSSKPPSSNAASSRVRQPSPSYSDLTRRFGDGHASTPELRPGLNASPHKRTRKLFNPKTAM